LISHDRQIVEGVSFAVFVADLAIEWQGLVVELERCLFLAQRIVDPTKVVEGGGFATFVTDLVIERQGLVTTVCQMSLIGAPKTGDNSSY